MKRTASRALVAALAATLALSGAVAAKDHPGKGAAHRPQVERAEKTSAGVVAGLKTKGNASHPGGVFRVLAIVKAAPADRPATVDAIVHFASGDVAVVLSRHGSSKGAAYHANVPVPDAEPAGTVVIDATALVAGTTLTATGSGKIVVGGDEAAEEAPDAVESPEAPEAVESPSACPSPAPTSSPEASATPEASSSPEASATPEASSSPEASATPEASASPSADPAAACTPVESTGFHLSAAAIARLVAFLEKLFA
jgi:hypothetical protein